MNTSKSPHTHINPNPHRSHHVLVVVIVLALLALSGVLIWLFWPSGEDATAPTDSTTTTVAEDPSTSDRPTVDSGEGTTTPTEPEDHGAPQYEADDPNTLSGLTGAVVRKTIQDDTLTIVAMIDQYLHSTGLCTLKLTSRNTGEVAFIASTDAVADVSTSICETFAVPLADLPAGTYQIQIELSGDDKAGMITDGMEVK